MTGISDKDDKDICLEKGEQTALVGDGFMQVRLEGYIWSLKPGLGVWPLFCRQREVTENLQRSS